MENKNILYNLTLKQANQSNALAYNRDYVAGNIANRKLDTGDIVSYYHVECVTYGFTSDYYSSY